MNLTRHLSLKPAMTKLILLINQPLSDIHDEQFSLQSVRLNASKLTLQGCSLLEQCICPWMDGSRTMQEQLSRSDCREILMYGD